MAEVPALAFRIRSSTIRGCYIDTAAQAARAHEQHAARAIAESCVSWLELFFLSALCIEYILDHHIHSYEEFDARHDELKRHVDAAFPGLQASATSLRDRILELPRPDNPGVWPELDWAQLVRSVDAIVIEAPIDMIEHTARSLSDPSLAYRARNIYDALRAFVRRHDPGHAEIMRIVGEQYRRGNLGLQDVAKLLNVSTSDAVFELEQDGFARPLSAIALDDNARDAIYQRLRARRRERSGPSVVDPELVERDVIASERIEGVDARAWIRRR